MTHENQSINDLITALGISSVISNIAERKFENVDYNTYFDLLSKYSKLKKEKEELEKLVRTDPLTGLYNRQGLEEALNKEFSAAIRKEKKLSLLMIDVNDFKKHNDDYGHVLGDEALIKIAECISKCIRNEDYAVRYGGDEFSILLPDTDIETAVEIAERMRKCVQSQLTNYGKGVTISIGAANYTDHCTTPKGLIDAADKALYQAKKNKNTTAVYTNC